MVYRVGERIMTFCIRPATLQLNQVITHCLFPSLPSVRILFRHIAGAPSKSLLVHADREPGTKSYSVVYLPFLLPSLRVVVCSFTFPMDYQQTSHLLPSFFFSAWKNTKYKTFPEILYFPFWFRKFFRFPLANIYIFLLKMLNQEELFSGLPYII